MKLNELFTTRQILSFEVFPPKRTSTTQDIYRTLDRMKSVHPAFISVTHGSSGKHLSQETLDIATTIKREYGIESVAHMPAINLTRDDAAQMLDAFKARGIDNVLALRGDRVEGKDPVGDFNYASDLVTFIRERGDFNIIAACYPEGHFETPRIVDDIFNLKRKVDAGATHLISQLCFNNEAFYEFRDKLELANITVPVQAGVFPVSNRKQIERILSMSRVSLPPKFVRILDRYEHSPLALRDAGIAYAIDQIIDLLTQGVQGIHLYTMNSAYTATKIYDAIENLLYPLHTK